MSSLRAVPLRRARSVTIAAAFAFAALPLAACAPDGVREPLAPSAAAMQASRAAADVALPFAGTLEAVETDDIDFETLISHTHIVGTGTASHLGRYTLDSRLVLDLQTLAGTQEATLTAANGDALTATLVAQGTETEPGVTVTTLETATITGGTGRFAGASGSYTLRRTLSEITHASSGAFTGTIRLAH